LKDVHFAFDRSDLDPAARETLKANADWLRANPLARVQIEGHCDERGTNEYNLALGARRAAASKDYVVSLGVSVDRLSTASYGEEIPVCKESTEECWAKNRRGRFVIMQGAPRS
jgi:peptidoglycan-associated lipoprotein